jgi:hypothetical protein
MHLRFAGAALWAALHVTAAWPQAAPSPAHQGHHPGKGEPAPAAKAESRAAAKAPAPRGSSGYQSPFADYRPFTPDEPLKDWRRANDEVREAGGHAGLMKPEPKR